MRFLKRFLTLNYPLILLGIFVLSIGSCARMDSDDLSGKFDVPKFTMTSKAMDEGMVFDDAPKFVFLEDQKVLVTSDFNHKMFKDSLYDYSIDKDKITFSSEMETLELPYQKKWQGIAVFPDNPYIRDFTMVKLPVQ